MAYPATFDVQPPTKEFDKAQIALRILIVIVLGWLLDAVLGFAYLLLPVVAAVLISQKGAEQYHAEAEAGPTKWLRYLMGFLSYVSLTTDELPLDRPEQVDLKASKIDGYKPWRVPVACRERHPDRGLDAGVDHLQAG